MNAARLETSARLQRTLAALRAGLPAGPTTLEIQLDEDPRRAAICVLWCPECSAGGFGSIDDYLFKNGRPLRTCSECNGWVHFDGCSRRRGKASARV